MPEVMRAWVEFALTRRGLARELIEETQVSIDPLVGESHKLATDHSSFGPAKAITDGMDLSDQASVDWWITEFNDRPFHERDEFLGPSPFDA